MFTTPKSWKRCRYCSHRLWDGDGPITRQIPKLNQRPPSGIEDMAVTRAALIERSIQRSGIDGRAECLIEGYCRGDNFTAVSRVETACVRKKEILPSPSQPSASG